MDAINQYLNHCIAAASLRDLAENDDSAYQQYDSHNDAAAAILKTLKRHLAETVSKDELFGTWQSAYVEMSDSMKLPVTDPIKARAVAMEALYRAAHGLSIDMKAAAGQ
jgi:hypothetical protein